MSDLVSVGGVCFVAVEPETRNANNGANVTYEANEPERAQYAETRESQNAGGKRKYRARGERSRREQQRAASRNYRLRHLEYYREYGLKYRAERKRLHGVTSWLQNVTD